MDANAIVLSKEDLDSVSHFEMQSGDLFFLSFFVIIPWSSLSSDEFRTGDGIKSMVAGLTSFSNGSQTKCVDNTEESN